MTVGKPHPQCYELAGRKLGVNVEECRAFEDAVAGILAARAADARVIVVSETHIGAKAHMAVRRLRAIARPA